MKKFGRMGGVLGALFAVMMLFVVPNVLYKMVPLAKRDVANDFVQAAKDWKQKTVELSYTPGPYEGVLVDWRDVIAVEAVKRNQDFRNVTYSDAYAATQAFTKVRYWEECHWHYPDEDDDWEAWEHCIDYHEYVLRDLEEEVMKDWDQDQKDWVFELADRADLLVKDDLECYYDNGNKKWVCND